MKDDVYKMPLKSLKVYDQERFEKGEEWFQKQLVENGFDLTKPIKRERETIADLSFYKQARKLLKCLE